MENQRRIYNPVQKDYVTFLKTSEETQGAYSQLEIELAPHGGNALHIHDEFTEAFEVLEGELNVMVDGEHKVLKAGDKAVVPLNAEHRFFSTSDQPTRFLVEIRPGHPGFETSLRIGYGLASDGGTNSAGIPKNILNLAYLINISGTKLNGPMRFVLPMLNALAALARMRGIDNQMAQKYLQAF